MTSVKNEILTTANAVISGDRPQEYGPPAENFTTIAEIWTSVLRRAGKLAEGASISPREVTLCMAGTKLAREANAHKKDNCVDGAGYFALSAELAPLDRPKMFMLIDHATTDDELDRLAKPGGSLTVDLTPI